MAQEIPLSEVIQELRRELQAAVDAGTGQSLRFEVQDLELEVQAVVTRGGSAKAGGGGGLKFMVFSADAKGEVSGKYESSQIQRIKLRLRPKGPEDEDLRLSGSRTEFRLPG